MSVRPMCVSSVDLTLIRPYYVIYLSCVIPRHRTIANVSITNKVFNGDVAEIIAIFVKIPVMCESILDPKL